jgi:hypothetical protein
MGDCVMGKLSKSTFAFIGLLAVHSCGTEGGDVASPFGADSSVETWSVPDPLRETADAVLVTDDGMLLIGHTEPGLVLSLRNRGSTRWSQATIIPEGFGWQVADSADGPIAVGAICEKPSSDMVCESEMLRLRAYSVSGDGVAAPVDGPQLTGVTLDGVDLQAASVGDSVVVAVRSATDTSTLFSLQDGVWDEIGTTEPVRRMCATSDTLHIQSFVVDDSPDVPVAQMPAPTKTPPTVPATEIPATESPVTPVDSAPVVSIPVGGQLIPDSAAIPLVMRQFDQDGLSKEVSIGSTVEGSRDGLIGCVRDRAEVMVDGEWNTLAPPPIIANARPGTAAQMVMVVGEKSQMPGYLDVTDKGDVVPRVLNGLSVAIPSKLDPGGSIIAAAHMNDSTILLVADASGDGLDSDSGPNSSRRIVVAPDR